MPECHQLGTRPTGEMEEVHPAIHLAVHSPHCGPHGVDTVVSVGVRIDDRPGELDQLEVSVCQLFGGDTHPGHGSGSVRQVRQSLGAPSSTTSGDPSLSCAARALAHSSSPATSIPYGGSS